jgi:hypothetical protein
LFYRVLADAVVLLHLLFIIFALLGGLGILWRRWVLAIHIPAAIWIAIVELNGWICPLTPLENRLRDASGAAGYAGGFIEHYIIPLIYPVGLTPNIQIVLGALAIVTNLAIYSFVAYRWLKTQNATK